VSIGLNEHCSLDHFGSLWRAMVVDLQTFENQMKTFDDARWMLTMTQVAPECQDTGRLAHLCRDTKLMRNTYKDKKMGHEIRGTRDGSSLATLRSTCWVVLLRCFLAIISLEIKGHTLPSDSWVCWLISLVAQPCRADQCG
jgi:hypothetical protein